MKLSDYLVSFLIEQGITDVFGYPGGSVSNLVDSLRKKKDEIKTHLTYHEQAAAFAACGYALTSGKAGVAYATGGPGCTNLITGIAHAYYDSIPTLFITGNVNTYEAKGDMGIRQRGFQESDNAGAVKAFTKYAKYVSDPSKIRYYMEKACFIANSGRKGPVLLDIPMDVFRAEIEPDVLEGFVDDKVDGISIDVDKVRTLIGEKLSKSKRPCFLFGNGIKNLPTQSIENVLNRLRIPCVTSMIAFDIAGNNPRYYGFLGAYGTRTANFIVAKSDLIIVIGSRMDIRQVGAKRADFAPNAEIIRIDADENELLYKVHDDEVDFCIDAEIAIDILSDIEKVSDYTEWNSVCNNIKGKLQGVDSNEPNRYIRMLGDKVLPDTVITTDVGQNQVWVAQDFPLKSGQRVLFSGGFGAMGCALPLAIGAYYGSSGKNIVCICGDGGMQMNIQELQFIAREKLPIKIVVFNNNALGMIRHFQEMYFEGEYYQTKQEGGYTTPDFAKVATAYGLRSRVITSTDQIEEYGGDFADDVPTLIEIRYNDNTYIIPKLEYGKPNQDQEPLIERNLYDVLMEL